MVKSKVKIITFHLIALFALSASETGLIKLRTQTLPQSFPSDEEGRYHISMGLILIIIMIRILGRVDILVNLRPYSPVY